MKTDAETLCGVYRPRSASAVSSSANRSRTSESFDAGKITVRIVAKNLQKHTPRSFEAYGLGHEGSASHSSTICFHSRTVSTGNVAVNSSATLR